MVMTVRGVLGDGLFGQTAPVVEAGAGGLDNVVRWAYTNERYDIADFLSGGELLIIEGSALLGGMNDHEIFRYVDALADARVAGLAIELVEGVRQVPPAMRARADARDLPVIGMHVRRPFVDLCESINTAIVRGRLLYHTHVDVLYTDLRRELSRARSAEDIAVGLSGLLGEQVDLFTATGRRVATAGMGSDGEGVPRDHAGDHAIFPVRRNGNPLAVVELTQRMRVIDSGVAEAIEHALDDYLPRMMDTDIAAAMVSRIARGPRNHISADVEEAQDAAVMLRALGHDTQAMHVPFAIVMRSLTESCDNVIDQLTGRGNGDGPRDAEPDDAGLDDVEPDDARQTVGEIVGDVDRSAGGNGNDDGHDDDHGGDFSGDGRDGDSAGHAVRHDIVPDAAAHISFVLDGRTLVGVLSCRAGGVDVAAACRGWLARVAARGQVWAVAGDVAPDARSLVDEAGMVDAALTLAPPAYGGVTRAVDLALRRFAACPSVGQACAMLTALMLPGGIRDDGTLMDTMAACFDAMDNKTEACSVLGIQRQTLYNRLDKVARVTGASRDDSGRWPLMLFAAKLALACDEQADGGAHGGAGQNVQSFGRRM